ncbi:MAG: MBL fold metallo-hydrolase [Actinomycetota bacterium]|nr:MBL fold metallo-hydrolase [Actinomycetota bacterium]
MELKIIYDNRGTSNEHLAISWGFSCQIRGEVNILFDTGGNASILLENMSRLDISPEDFEAVIISHNHYDHTSGLWGFLEKNPNVEVYILGVFPKRLKDRIKNYGSTLAEVDKFCEIFPDVYTTGKLGQIIPEQSLILKRPQGLVVITGCAHPGIVDILQEVGRDISEEIFLVVGGFHLMGQPEGVIKSIIHEFKELGVERVAPTHCTGDKAMKLFKEEYKENFMEVGVGTSIKV